MSQPTDSEIKKILQEAKTIAIAGASDKPDRDSYLVMRYLLDRGYNVIPVNPAYQQILGKKCYPNIRQIKEPVHIVDIFRKSDEVMTIVEDAVAIGAKTVWMQLGIINDEAADLAHDSSLNVIMNRCVKIEYNRLMHD
ncbi:MAG: CoA-binding protein [Bacteroidota bacterium]|nr:CoA-binding protein [Bacteroidota bacterium]